MFKTVLDLASIDYNSIMENAMEALKKHPEAVKAKGIKLPGKLQMLLFKKLPDDQKTLAIAQMINSMDGQPQICLSLEQMLSGLFAVRVTRVEARPEEAGLALRIIADMEDMNSEMALAKLFPTLAMVPDYPDILGPAYRPGMNAQDALSAALNLPEAERELAVLKLIKHAKPTLLGSLETAACAHGIRFHLADLKFLVPR